MREYTVTGHNEGEEKCYMAYTAHAVNHVFSANVLNDLQKNGHSNVLESAVHDCVSGDQSLTYGDVFKQIYQYLAEHQRNEYFYQNTLFQKLLLKKHSLSNTAAFRQLRVGASIADFVMINGKGCVYEIKSDLDNFERLESQLRDYYTGFGNVSVVVPEKNYTKVIAKLDSFHSFGSKVGVYSITKRQAISSKYFRNPIEYTKMLEHESLFKMLRKAEYEQILFGKFNCLPDVRQVDYFRTCFNLFEKIPVVEAQALTLQQIKKRKLSYSQNLEHVQKELQSVVYFSTKRYDIEELNSMMSRAYQGE